MPATQHSTEYRGPVARIFDVTPARCGGWVAVVVSCFVLVAAVGCRSRGFYRHQADAEAACLIEQKSRDPRWDNASGTVAVDATSRLFDPFCPDHIPLPPDDPTSADALR